jgi:hypothetical protein
LLSFNPPNLTIFTHIPNQLPPTPQVLSIYEVRSLQDQRRLLSELYDKDAIYENNVTLLRGRDEIIKRFALLPVSTHSVKLEYEKPVVLGATTSA